MSQPSRPQPGDEDLSEESRRPDDGLLILATSLGNFFAGWIASFADRYPLYRLFTLDFLLPAAGAIVLAMLIKPLRKLAT